MFCTAYQEYRLIARPALRIVALGMRPQQPLLIEELQGLLQIALARGKRHHDKRAAIREREVQREMDRALKTR